MRFVTLDSCDPYKRFANEHFPNAQLVADKFHVLRLLQPALMRYRKLAEDGRNSPYLLSVLPTLPPSIAQRLLWLALRETTHHQV